MSINSAKNTVFYALCNPKYIITLIENQAKNIFHKQSNFVISHKKNTSNPSVLFLNIQSNSFGRNVSESQWVFERYPRTADRPVRARRLSV